MNAWYALENRRFPRCFNMGKVQDEIVKNVKMGQTWVPSRDDSSATAGPIGMGQTRVGRELIKLANAESVKYWRASRALLEALSWKKSRFWAIFHDWHWYSETTGREDKKPTQFSRGMYRLSNASKRQPFYRLFDVINRPGKQKLGKIGRFVDYKELP